MFERLGPVEALEDRWVLSTLSLMDASATEGNMLGFEVWLDAPNDAEITIQYSTADGTATSPADFTSAGSGSLTITASTLPASSYPLSVALIEISASSDSETEGDELFALNIDSISEATLGDGNAIGTIVDDVNSLPGDGTGDESLDGGGGGDSGCVCGDETADADAGGLYNIQAGDTLTLDGSASSSTYCMPTFTFAWILNGTNVGVDASSVSIGWDTLKATYGFAKGATANTYTVAFGFDDSNDTDSDSVTVTVAANQPPVPGIAGAGDDGTIHINAGYLTLDSSPTTDPDDIDISFLTYSWDVLADGTSEGTSLTLSNSWLALAEDFGFEVGESYPVKLTVSDGIATVSKTVTVVVDNIAPEAIAIPFGVDHYEIYVGKNLSLNASDSADVDGGPDPLTFEWDLDGDGDFDDASGESPSVNWATLSSLFGSSPAGSHSVTLKVSDGDLEDTDSVTLVIKLPTVFIVEGPDPVLNEKAAPGPGEYGKLTVFRTGPTTSSLVVSYSLGGTADEADDYASLSGTITIPAGSAEAGIDLIVLNDDEVERPETIIVVISQDDSKYLRDLTQVQATATIYDGDSWEWDTFSGTEHPNVQLTQLLPGRDSGPQDPSYMSLSGAITATNSSISANMLGHFYDDVTLGNDIDLNISRDVGLSFQFDQYTGFVTLQNRDGQLSEDNQGVFSSPLKFSPPRWSGWFIGFCTTQKHENFA